jgi:nicotinamide-nucleotide amidase
MKAAILSIGDELVLGQTVDTNSAWLSARLVEYGIMPAWHLTVADDRAMIADAFRRASSECELVIVSGGLGPTEDDLTRHGLADAMGVGLELHEPSLEHIRGFFTRRNRAMPEINKIQAMMPVGSTVLDNPVGTAPGIRARLGRAEIFITPGVPKEMFHMYERHIRPYIQMLSNTSGGGGRAIITTKVNTFGLGESDIGIKLGDLMDRKRNPTVGTTVSEGLVSIRIRSEFPTRDEALAQLEDTVKQVETRLAPLAFGRDDQRLQDTLLKLLLEHKKTVATAESCTAGLLAKCITDPPGSSSVFVGGWVTYTNDLKHQQLGVPSEVFTTVGAVSQECATAMADGALQRSGADYALSLTGIAGPSGGSADKPVGTVWIALADRTRPTIAMRFVFPGDREMIRDRAAKTAMNMLRLRLMKLD